MKKVLMLALLVLGTATFANVKPVAKEVKGTATKEISVRKHKKSRKAKKVEAIKAETPQTKK